MLATLTRRAACPLALMAFVPALLLTALTPARAAEPQSQPATRAATQPTTQPSTVPVNPELEKRAKAVIEQALAKYRAAKSYQDKLDVHSEFVATDKEGNDVGQTEEYSTKLLFAAPNRVALTADDYAINCDGKRLWLYIDALDQYTEAPAPDRLDYSKLGDELNVDQPPHPVLFVLTEKEKAFDELFPMVRGFTAIAREEREGKPGTRIAGLFDALETPLGFGPELIPFSLWFDEKTGLLGELRIDLTAAIRKVMGLTGEKPADGEEEDFPGRPKKLERAEIQATFNEVKVDADIPADRFVFNPAAGMKKVAEFDWEAAMRMPEPQDLIGEPAPAFSGDGLDGKPLSLESLRGRVVVLDFWATWCVPCVKALPGILKVSEKYTDQPVTVIGMNQDAKGAEQKVKKFVADKKLAFRQFLDSGGKIGKSYKVMGIPTTFLIDKKGVVQAVHVGFEAKETDDLAKKQDELAKELGEQIDKLLKGENLYDPEKIAKEKKEREAVEPGERPKEAPEPGPERKPTPPKE